MSIRNEKMVAGLREPPRGRNNSWVVPLLVLATTAIPMIVGAVLLTRDRKFEDLAAIRSAGPVGA